MAAVFQRCRRRLTIFRYPIHVPGGCRSSFATCGHPQEPVRPRIRTRGLVAGNVAVGCGELAEAGAGGLGASTVPAATAEAIAPAMKITRPTIRTVSPGPRLSQFKVTQIGMLAKKVRDLGLDRLGQQSTRPMAQDFGERS